MTTLALDIGGTKTLVALVEGIRVVDEARLSTDPSGGGEGIVEAVAEVATRWSGRFDCLGAAVTGCLRDGTWQALNLRTLPLPRPFPLERALEDRFGCPAHAVNDAQAAAWGEWSAGAGRREDMVFLTVSTGIGGGIVTGGQLVGGLGGSFGQFVDEAGARLEDRASGRWMAAAARDAGHRVEAAKVFAALPAPWADAIVEESASRLAVLCRNIQLALDPRRIVIGGGIGLAPGYIARIEAALADVDPVLRPKMSSAALGAYAGVIGAAAIAQAQTGTTKHRENA